MSSLKFIGHLDFVSNGKFLWEILTQLKSMGVGRYVTKSEWLTKWQNEPSYLKIVGARPKMDRWLQDGHIWAEWTFRGHNLGIYEFNSNSNINRSDWILIHKHDEKKFLGDTNKLRSSIQLPSSLPVPPLQKHLADKCAKKYGITSLTQERTPMDLCIDPQFEFMASFIKQIEPEKQNNKSTIYDEVDAKHLLDLYGNMIPVKVEAWSTDPAKYENHFGPNK